MVDEVRRTIDLGSLPREAATPRCGPRSVP